MSKPKKINLQQFVRAAIPLAIFLVFFSYGNNGLAVPEKNSCNIVYNQVPPDSLKAVQFYNRGCRNFDSGKYHRAIRNFSKAIKSNPCDPDPYCNRGVVYYKLQLYEQALNDIKKAVDLDTNDAILRYNLANVYYMLKDYDNAEKEYLITLRLDSTHLNVNCALGNIYSSQELYDKSIEYYQKELELNPDDAFAAACLQLVRTIKTLEEE